MKHLDQKKIYKCSMCKITFLNENNLDNHFTLCKKYIDLLAKKDLQIENIKNTHKELEQKTLELIDDLEKETIKLREDLEKETIKIREDLDKEKIKMREDLEKETIKMREDFGHKNFELIGDFEKKIEKIENEKKGLMEDLILYNEPICSPDLILNNIVIDVRNNFKEIDLSGICNSYGKVFKDYINTFDYKKYMEFINNRNTKIEKIDFNNYKCYGNIGFALKLSEWISNDSYINIIKWLEKCLDVFEKRIVGEKIHNESTLNINGISICMRKKDGYINATSLCKIGNKFFSQYRKDKNTEVFLYLISKKLSIPIKELIVNSFSNVFVHQKIAVHLSNWIMPSLYIEVSEWIESFREFGTVSEAGTGISMTRSSFGGVVRESTALQVDRVSARPLHGVDRVSARCSAVDGPNDAALQVDHKVARCSAVDCEAAALQVDGPKDARPLHGVDLESAKFMTKSSEAVVDRRHLSCLRYTETREYFFKKIEDLSSYYNLIFTKYENTSYLYITFLGEDSMGKYRFIQGESGNLKLNSKIILIRECFNINVCEYKFRKFIDKHGYVLRTVDLGLSEVDGNTELEYGSNIFSIDGIRDLEKIMTKMKKICKENILEFKNTYTIKNFLEKKIELKNIEFEIKKLEIELSNTKSNRYTYTYTSDSDKIEDNVITSFFD